MCCLPSLLLLAVSVSPLGALGPTPERPDTAKVYELDDIVVFADRRKSPVAMTDLAPADIDRLSYGQDVPVSIAATPSAYAYSDAGNGFGYSYLKIRGFDQDRIGMQVNGVPINDPESHQAYWIDHGDILAGSSRVQIQRGVGANLFGATSFGGSVNVRTSPATTAPGVTLATGYGFYTDEDIDQPTRMYRATFATGPILDERAVLYARYSRQDSEGYRRASAADLESFALSALYGGGRWNHKLDVLSGRQVSHFAWDGLSPSFGADLSDRDARRDNVYEIYPNNVDDFAQVITSITSETTAKSIRFSNTLYYVDGEGFFEQFESESPFFTYGFDPIVVGPDSTIAETDIVRRRWLVNRYWGLLPQARFALGASEATVGLGFRRYDARHFGEVVWTDADVTRPPLDRYYDHDTGKTSAEAYAQLEARLARRTRATLALQAQAHRYDFTQRRVGNFPGYAFEADYTFVSPRVGIRQDLSDLLAVRALVSYAQREPSSNDYLDEDDPASVPAFENADDELTGLDDPIVKPEKLLDVELALELHGNAWSAGVTAYQLEFRDQLIPIDGGRLEEEGRLERANAEKTRHQGVELEGVAELTRSVALRGNLALARHRFVDHEIFAYWLDDYAGGMLRLDGNTIPRSPSILANVGADMTRGAWGAGVELQHVGKQYVEGENIESIAIDPYTVVNVTGKVSLDRWLGRPVRLEARLLNAFDVLYETFGYSYYDGSPAAPIAFYWPAATRSVFLTLEMRF